MGNIRKHLRDAAGFTLVELVVVMAILGILAGGGTVAYSGYVQQANKAADKQLASDIVYAVKLAAYTEDIEGEGVIGYVVLSDEEDAVAEATLTDADGNTSTLFDTAMADAFGSGWAQTARLSYNGWTDTATMLNEVANNEYASSVNSSSYVNSVGTEQLLAGVQNCATALSAFMEQLSSNAITTLAAFLGDDLYDLLEAAGYSADDDYAGVVTDTLSNAVVFCLAKYVDTNAETVVKGFYDCDILSGDVSNLYLSKNLLSYANSSDLLYIAANWYAAGEAVVAYLDDDYCTTTFEGIDFSSSNATTILANMLTAYQSIANYVSDSYYQTEVGQRFLAYYSTAVSNGKTQAQLDGESYVAILQTVNSLYADYLDSLSDSALFTSSGMLTRVNSYVAAASLKDYIDDGALADVVDGSYGSVNLVLIFTTDENGSISCIACPNDAYTES